MPPVAFDYVIVGAGSAGCVLAARLGEDPDIRIAVIEAGPPDTDPEIHMPFAFGALLKSRVDWDLVTEAEPGLAGRRTYLPRGRVLGGSSSLNAMIYIRGNRADYDEWAAMGSTAGATRTCCRTSSRAEDNERGESYYHGIGGPLTVSDSRSMHPLVDACDRSGPRNRSRRRTTDHNGATPGRRRPLPGHATQRAALQHRGRVSPSRRGARQHRGADRRPVATRILFEGDHAVGVEILRRQRARGAAGGA